MLTRSISLADRPTICTGLSKPTNSGPITVAPPSSCSILVEMDAEWNAGMTSTLAGPDRRQKGYAALSSTLSATSAAMSPSYSKSTRRWSRSRTAPSTCAARSPGGWPKVEKARSASRGSYPSRRATPATSTAMSARFSGRHLGDRSVGDEHRASAREHQRDADHPMAGLGIDAMLHLGERDREVAGDPRHHGVDVAERHHAGGEVVAVLVDQALAVADQIALPLQALVQIGGVIGIALRQAGIDDLDAFPQFDSEIARGLAHAVLAADQVRRAEPLMDVDRGGADHLLLFALGDHDPFGR